MKTNGQRRPEEIQAEIERTRSDLNETLHAIERRLTPGQLVDQGLHYLRESGANEYLTNLRTTATRDPLPLALVGVGLAWLAMSSRRPPPVPTTSELPGEPSAMSSTMSTMKDKVSQTTHKLSETTQRVTQAAHAARERASRMGTSARHQAERLRGGYEHLVNEQPLALGAIGLALGAVLAAATPRARMEEETLGERTLPEGEGLQGLERERVDSEMLAEQSHSRPETETPWPQRQQPGMPPDLGTMPP